MTPNTTQHLFLRPPPSPLFPHSVYRESIRIFFGPHRELTRNAPPRYHKKQESCLHFRRLRNTYHSFLKLRAIRCARPRDG